MKKLKKIIPIVILLVLVIFITKFIHKLSINEIKTTYKLNNYTINERFYIDNKQHNYEITISNKNNKYNFIKKENLNKKSKIIKEVKIIKENKIECIIPLYVKKTNLEIYCNNDNESVSIDYLLKNNNEDLKKIKNKIKKYNINYPKEKDNKEKYNKLEVYKDNIDDNEIIYVWDYKGIYIVDNEKIKYKKILDYDLYDNIVATTINNNYVLFENTSVKGIENIYYYNYNDDKLKKIKVKEKISKEVYINGIRNNLIYFTDVRNKKEYTLDIKKEIIEEIDNNQTKYIIYKNNKEIIISKSDYFKNKKFFSNYEFNNENISDEIIKEDNNYYYYIENNNLYRQNKKSDIRVLLFELENIKEWYIQDENIYLVSGKILYRYNDKKGLNKLILENELKYNYEEITKIGRK